MARQEIDLTTPQPNGKMGEPTKSAWEKVNNMTAELYPLATSAIPNSGGTAVGPITVDLGNGTPAFLATGGGESSTVGDVNYGPFFESRLKNRLGGGLRSRVYIAETVGSWSETVIESPNGAFFRFRENGQAYCTQWVNTSDSRIKKDKVVISDPLDAIDKIYGYSYYKQNSVETNRYFYSTYGLIADEVESALPGSTSVVAVKGVDVEGNEISNILGVNDTPVVALLVECVKELKKRVAALESRA